MSDCSCGLRTCVHCWPKCEECDSALGDEEMRYCGVCCRTFPDCHDEECAAREKGVRFVAASNVTASTPVLNEATAICSDPPQTPAPSGPNKIEPPLTVGTEQTTFAFWDDGGG